MRLDSQMDYVLVEYTDITKSLVCIKYYNFFETICLQTEFFSIKKEGGFQWELVAI